MERAQRRGARRLELTLSVGPDSEIGPGEGGRWPALAKGFSGGAETEGTDLAEGRRAGRWAERLGRGAGVAQLAGVATSARRRAPRRGMQVVGAGRALWAVRARGISWAEWAGRAAVAEGFVREAGMRQLVGCEVRGRGSRCRRPVEAELSQLVKADPTLNSESADMAQQGIALDGLRVAWWRLNLFVEG